MKTKLMRRNLIQDKKADFGSLIYVVIFIAALGLVMFLIQHMNHEIFTEILETINETQDKYPEAVETMTDIRSIDDVIWDWVFLAVYLGSIIAIGMSAYAIRISPIFYWIYAILGLVVLATGTMLSNLWQDFSADPTFAITITRFPITNLLLGSYYPVAITFVLVLAMVILFGKPPEDRGGYY